MHTFSMVYETNKYCSESHRQRKWERVCNEKTIHHHQRFYRSDPAASQTQILRNISKIATQFSHSIHCVVSLRWEMNTFHGIIIYRWNGKFETQCERCLQIRFWRDEFECVYVRRVCAENRACALDTILNETDWHRKASEVFPMLMVWWQRSRESIPSIDITFFEYQYGNSVMANRRYVCAFVDMTTSLLHTIPNDFCSLRPKRTRGIYQRISRKYGKLIYAFLSLTL